LIIHVNPPDNSFPELEPQFPLEFLVEGTPVHFQGGGGRGKKKAADQWKQRVREASNAVLPEGHFATSRRLAVTLYYFPAVEMQGDVDNIIKYILDALKQHVYPDDSQVERIVAQKFEPGRAYRFSNPSATLTDALNRDRP